MYPKDDIAAYKKEVERLHRLVSAYQIEVARLRECLRIAHFEELADLERPK